MVKLISGNTSSKGASTLLRSPLSEFPSPEGPQLCGIYTLALPKHFVAIGAHACNSCRLLKSVDLCNTMIEEIPEFTFVHCTSLREVFQPATLHTIRVKAFMNCAALVELAIPPSLKYIGSRAFLDCTALRRLVKMPGTSQMARGLCGRKCLRHLSGYEVATLAAYDPGHGLHPWSRIENHPSIHNCHGPAVGQHATGLVCATS